jgi:hypothetical protein
MATERVRCRRDMSLAVDRHRRYRGVMENDTPVPSKVSLRLLSVTRVRTLATAANPEYGRDFSEADWERITERLEALARLLWQVSLRTAEGERPGGFSEAVSRGAGDKPTDSPT